MGPSRRGRRPLGDATIHRASAAALAFIVAAALACVVSAAERSRDAELKRVIDRNTGFAHMTRGVNMYTLIALRSCVTEQDIPVLARLVADRDHVTQLASASVLADLGENGMRALRQGLATAPDARTRGVIEDALREADAPTRRPIMDYPLSEQERRRIRGCRAPAAGH